MTTNAAADTLTVELRDAEAHLDTAKAAHRAVPARFPLGQVTPGQQVLDVRTKLITHAIRIAAFNTATALAQPWASTPVTPARTTEPTPWFADLTGNGDIDPGNGDIDPGNGVLTVRLDPCPRVALSPLSRNCVSTSLPPRLPISWVCVAWMSLSMSNRPPRRP
jgi:hypothetical protein